MSIPSWIYEHLYSGKMAFDCQWPCLHGESCLAAEMLLRHLGYVWYRGKGSHQNWKHPRRTRIFTLAVHGKELPRYITRELRRMLLEEGV